MDPVKDLVLAAAVRDFRAARRKAAMQDILARLTGKSDDLLAYAEVARMVKAEEAVNRGLQDIPLDAIVGSVGRYGDFTRTFLPRADVDETRWARLKLKALYEGGFPPIEVYKVGDVYFVLDGNHRVSVAREMGATHIQAYVTEVPTRVPLEPGVQPDDLIIKARYAEFLERTGLDRSRPQADFTMTVPGQYRALEEEIEIHRRRLEQAGGGPVSLAEAAADWYDQVYRPVVEMIRRHELLEDFPERTEADLYVWISQHRAELAEELGWPVDAGAAAADLFTHRRRASRRRRRLLEALTPEELREGPEPGWWREERRFRSSSQLFSGLLVAVNGRPDGWVALDQALVIARWEGAAVHGLHVVRRPEQQDDPHVADLRAEFAARCVAAGLQGVLHVEAGPVARTLCQRARWTDLIVLKLSHPPGEGPLEKLSSGLRVLIQRCSRPLLAVPGEPSALRRPLLAYDGSPKAREALYVAAYLAHRWQAELTVLTVADGERVTAEALAEAQAYLQERSVAAQGVLESGPPAEAILSTAAERRCDLLIMGGYGFSPLWQVVLGSTVDEVARATRLPLLICR